MKTLLLCGYRDCDDADEAVGIDRSTDDKTLIDRRITQLRQLGFDVVCVLAGNRADVQLRQCKSIESCDLVFDTNEPHCNLISNLRAGTFHLENEGAFVLPVEIPVPDQMQWRFLLNEYGRSGFGQRTTFLQLRPTLGAPCQYGFPLLLTREGAKFLRDTPNLTSLVDSRLQYRQLEIETEQDITRQLPT